VFEIAYYIHLKIAVLLKEHLKDEGGSADCPDDDPYFFFSKKCRRAVLHYIKKKRGQKPLQHTPTPPCKAYDLWEVTSELQN
jgi:hypothetical protein